MTEKCYNKKCKEYDELYDDHCNGHGIRWNGNLCNKAIFQPLPNDFLTKEDFENE